MVSTSPKQSMDDLNIPKRDFKVTETMFSAASQKPKAVLMNDHDYCIQYENWLKNEVYACTDVKQAVTEEEYAEKVKVEAKDEVEDVFNEEDKKEVVDVKDFKKNVQKNSGHLKDLYRGLEMMGVGLEGNLEELADPLGTEVAESKMINKRVYEDLEAGVSSDHSMVDSPSEEQDVALLTKRKTKRQGTMKQELRETLGVTVWVNSEKEDILKTGLWQEDPDVSLDPLSNIFSAPVRPKSPPKLGVIHNFLEMEQRAAQEREQIQGVRGPNLNLEPQTHLPGNIVVAEVRSITMEEYDRLHVGEVRSITMEEYDELDFRDSLDNPMPTYSALKRIEKPGAVVAHLVRQKRDMKEETPVKKVKMELKMNEEEIGQVSSDKMSSSTSDYVRVQCSLCPVKPTMTCMRQHVRSHHQINITEYKEMYGPLVPLQVMLLLIMFLLMLIPHHSVMCCFTTVSSSCFRLFITGVACVAPCSYMTTTPSPST